MKTALAALSAISFLAVAKGQCTEQADPTCIAPGKACTGHETECCGVEGSDMGCYGYNFFKTCQEKPVCLSEWSACMTDGHSIDCCGDLKCIMNEAGTATDCMKPTVELVTRTVDIFDLKNDDEDPKIDDKPNLLTTPKPDPMEFWVGCIKGDPHITTFDGQKYDCQGVGEFIAVESQTTRRQVQTRFRPFKSKSDISVLRGFTVQDEGDTPKVQITSLEDPAQTDQIATTITDTCKIQLFVNDVQKDLDVGYEDTKVKIYKTNKRIIIEYLDSGMIAETSVSSACTFGSCFKIPKGDPTLIGLLGSPDEDTANDWMKPDGKIADEDITMASDDNYAQLYCTKNWCINNRDDSMFKYNEPGWSHENFDMCNLPSGTSFDEVKDNEVTPEILKLCRNNGDCVLDAIMEGTESVRDFFFDDAMLKEQVHGKGGRCNPGGCKKGLECVDFGGFVGFECADKTDKNFCHVSLVL